MCTGEEVPNSEDPSKLYRLNFATLSLEKLSPINDKVLEVEVLDEDEISFAGPVEEEPSREPSSNMRFLREEKKIARAATLPNKKGQFRLKDFIESSQSTRRANTENLVSLNKSPSISTASGNFRLPHLQIERAITKEHTSFF